MRSIYLIVLMKSNYIPVLFPQQEVQHCQLLSCSELIAFQLTSNSHVPQ